MRDYSEDSSSRLNRKKPLIAELQIQDFNEIYDKVKAKQFELVRLAELEGIRSNKAKDYKNC